MTETEGTLRSSGVSVSSDSIPSSRLSQVHLSGLLSAPFSGGFSAWLLFLFSSSLKEKFIWTGIFQGLKGDLVCVHPPLLYFFPFSEQL